MAKERTIKYREVNSAYYQKNKTVRAAYMKVWRSKNKDKLKISARKKHFKRNYGLSLEDRDKMITERSNKCDICFNSFKGSLETHVDHDHSTGKVRGLLCVNCNHGLGRFKDNITILSNAIKYLEKNI